MWFAGPVQAALLQALARRATAIRARWVDLLRAEPAASPLANPEALVHLVGWTLRTVLRRLQAPGTRRRPRRPHARSARCESFQPAPPAHMTDGDLRTSARCESFLCVRTLAAAESSSFRRHHRPA